MLFELFYEFGMSFRLCLCFLCMLNQFKSIRMSARRLVKIFSGKNGPRSGLVGSQPGAAYPSLFASSSILRCLNVQHNVRHTELSSKQSKTMVWSVQLLDWFRDCFNFGPTFVLLRSNSIRSLVCLLLLCLLPSSAPAQTLAQLGWV